MDQPRTTSFSIGLLKTESEPLDQLGLSYGWFRLMYIFFWFFET